MSVHDVNYCGVQTSDSDTMQSRVARDGFEMVHSCKDETHASCEPYGNSHHRVEEITREPQACRPRDIDLADSVGSYYLQPGAVVKYSASARWSEGR